MSKATNPLQKAQQNQVQQIRLNLGKQVAEMKKQIQTIRQQSISTMQNTIEKNVNKELKSNLQIIFGREEAALQQVNKIFQAESTQNTNAIAPPSAGTSAPDIPLPSLAQELKMAGHAMEQANKAAKQAMENASSAAKNALQATMNSLPRKAASVSGAKK